jgi:uncharacterized phage protein (TIGR02216 family)
MEAGLGTLRLPPAVFWTMTPRELEAALRGAFGVTQARPLSRADLAALMAAYPDEDDDAVE